MEIKTLAELQQPDEASLMFAPGADSHVARGYCGCPVEARDEGQLPGVLTMAAAEGASVTPIAVRDTRITMSMTPRCNRILGNGAWDIPPDDPSMARLFAAPA